MNDCFLLVTFRNQKTNFINNFPIMQKIDYGSLWIYLMVASIKPVTNSVKYSSILSWLTYPMGKKWGCEIDIDVGSTSIGCAYLLVRWPNLLMFTRA